MPELERDQYVDLILDALSGIESGGNYGAKSPQKAYGKYQFIPSTWSMWSRKLTESAGLKPQILKELPENQEAVARFKVNTLIDEGKTPQEIASIWYSGRPDYQKLKGVTDAHGKLDVPQYVDSFWNRFNESAKSLFSSLGPAEAGAADIQSKYVKPSAQDLEDARALIQGAPAASTPAEGSKPMTFDWDPKDAAAELIAGAPKKEAPVIKSAIPDGAPDWARQHPDMYWKAVDALKYVDLGGDIAALTGGAKLGAAVGLPAGGPIGSAIGAVVGAGMMYGGKEGALSYLRQYLGQEQPYGFEEGVKKGATAIGKGMMYEMGGQSGGKLIGETAEAFKGTLPLSVESIERKAGQVLTENTSKNPVYAKNAEEAAQVEEAIPGTKFTLGERTNDPALIKLQRGMERFPGPQADATLRTREANQDAIHSYLSKEFKGTETVDDVIDALTRRRVDLETARKTAEEVVGNIEARIPTVSPQQAGSSMVESIQKAKAPVREKEAELWGRVPNYPMPARNTETAFSEVLARPSTAKAKIQWIKDIADELPNTVEGLTTLEREVDSAMRALSATDTERHFLRQIKDAIRKDFDDLGAAAKEGDIALSDGEVVIPSRLHSELSALDEQIAKAQQKATTAPDIQTMVTDLRAKKIPNMRQVQEGEEAFNARIQESWKRANPGQEVPTLGAADNTALAELTARKARLESRLAGLEPADDVARAYTAAKDYSREEYFKRFKRGEVKKVLSRGDEISGLRTPPEQVPRKFWTESGADDFIRAVGEEQARTDMSVYAANDMLKRTQLDPVKLRAWRRSNEIMLKKYRLLDEFTTVEKATDALEAARQAERAFEKSAAAKMLNADPQNAIARAMEGGGGLSPKNTGAIMQDLMKQVEGDKRAVAGLQTAFKDFLVEKAETLLDAKTLTKDLRQMTRDLAKYNPAMKVLYKGDMQKYSAIKNVQKAIKIQSRSIQSPLGGGSDTAENLNIVRSIIWKLIQKVPGLNWGADVALVGANKVKQMIDHAQEKKLMEFLTRAMYDPEYATALRNIGTMGPRDAGQFSEWIQRKLTTVKGGLPALDERYLSDRKKK